MNSFINIGYGNMINAAQVVSIVSPDAAPIKRMVKEARENGLAVDATCGRRAKAVIFTKSQYIVLSALLPETIAARAMENGK